MVGSSDTSAHPTKLMRMIGTVQTWNIVTKGKACQFGRDEPLHRCYAANAPMFARSFDRLATASSCWRARVGQQFHANS